MFQRRFKDTMITLQDVITAAESHGLNYEKVVTRDDGSYQILFSWEPNDSYLWWGGTGFLQSEQQCINFAYDLLSSMDTEELMKLLKNDKLFPHIRGVMLKDKRFTLTLSGKVQITELQGGDARAELHFTNHAKTAVINRNQLLKIIEVYGDDTDDMKGAPITLYGEHGKWFGKEQWGIRVDLEETQRQATKAGYVYSKKDYRWVKKGGDGGQQPAADRMPQFDEEWEQLFEYLEQVGEEVHGEDFAQMQGNVALAASGNRTDNISDLSADELREAINNLELERQSA